MSKQEQVLTIKPPNELTFVGPFTQPVSSVMYLSNPSERKVCFKIKTTAPKRYCVKPNSGIIDPSEQVKISVSLQPFEFVPAEKNKHKFMVQSMYAPEGEIHQDLLWKEVDTTQLMDSKLKCVFVMPDNNGMSAGSADVGGEYSASSSMPSITASTNSHLQQATAEPSSQAASQAAPIQHAVNSNQNSQADRAAKAPQGDIDGDGNRKSMEEIKKLQEELSALRQENIQLREEALRQQRLASSRSGDSGSGGSAGSDVSGGFSVSAMNPDANALSVNYLYMALFILVVGIIMGKVIF